ncbi:8-oxo-dGTP diphosphatase [Microbacterium endophyticum]|uniref:Oxidized purine nucleoside triphosphate hydrolase n=1 Tax=Microbacterium endophyticum TaxID=1526412 RepID=A0A7W4YMW9_9MICO|nr:8-oxo-dGTP diphosphatase [Microbacterium endophyticum]MBB2975954.1 8-oxo-dGTP diphosphatase [Microbacterium endophyticum]NIK37677.1 8-oxo-dGTP diphosphatase [Microbacterium endophyticum]
MNLPEVCAVYMMRPTATSGTEVLLGHKRTGLGLGRIVGIGGKIERGETVREGAVREVQEETGLLVEASDLVAVGVLDYLFPSQPTWSQRSHVFTCTAWTGEPVETDEIVPKWYSIDDIPFERMWDDASRWLPGILRGNSGLNAIFTFGDDLATVVNEAPRAVA